MISPARKRKSNARTSARTAVFLTPSMLCRAGLGAMWGGLTVKIGTHVGAGYVEPWCRRCHSLYTAFGPPPILSNIYFLFDNEAPAIIAR